MKKIKMFALMAAFTLTIVVGYASKGHDDDPFTMGVTDGACFSPQSLNEGTCYDSGAATPCTLSGTSDIARVSNSGCGAILKTQP